MTQSPYLTVREAAHILGIAEGKIMQLVEDHKLQAYRIADQYLRLKREDVQQLKNSGDVVSDTVKYPYSFQERLRDIILYNDFYLVSFIIIIALLLIILLGR